MSVAGYLKELPADRRKEIATVRAVIKKNLPDGYEEAMAWGMISYQVPLSLYSKTYNKAPIVYVALAAQKNYNSIYMMRVSGDKTQEAQLRAAFTKAGKTLDMGKSCILFKTADELPLDTIGELVASTPSSKWIEIFEASRKR
jgi:hypothetical protein